MRRYKVVADLEERAIGIVKAEGVGGSICAPVFHNDRNRAFQLCWRHMLRTMGVFGRAFVVDARFDDPDVFCYVIIPLPDQLPDPDQDKPKMQAAQRTRSSLPFSAFPRERLLAILRSLCTHKTYDEIANNLGVSRSMIEQIARATSPDTIDLWRRLPVNERQDAMEDMADKLYQAAAKP
jgi:hypothetical protein